MDCSRYWLLKFFFVVSVIKNYFVLLIKLDFYIGYKIELIIFLYMFNVRFN